MNNSVFLKKILRENKQDSLNYSISQTGIKACENIFNTINQKAIILSQGDSITFKVNWEKSKSQLNHQKNEKKKSIKSKTNLSYEEIDEHMPKEFIDIKGELKVFFEDKNNKKDYSIINSLFNKKSASKNISENYDLPLKVEILRRD